MVPAHCDTVYPNIVPPNDLRLLDALTIKHGPTRLLARFMLEGDKMARRVGLHLRLRHDFDELLFINRKEAARGHWYPLVRRVQSGMHRAESGERLLDFRRGRQRRDRRHLGGPDLQLDRHQFGRAGARLMVRSGSGAALHRHGAGGVDDFRRHGLRRGVLGPSGLSRQAPVALYSADG